MPWQAPCLHGGHTPCHEKKTYEGMKHSLSTQPKSISLDVCRTKCEKHIFRIGLLIFFMQSHKLTQFWRFLGRPVPMGHFLPTWNDRVVHLSYPLVNVYSLRTWTWWFIVDLPSYNMVIFRDVNVYQRVTEWTKPLAHDNSAGRYDDFMRLRGRSTCFLAPRNDPRYRAPFSADVNVGENHRNSSSIYLPV